MSTERFVGRLVTSWSEQKRVLAEIEEEREVVRREIRRGTPMINSQVSWMSHAGQALAEKRALKNYNR